VSSKDEFESLPFSTHSFIRPQKDPAEQVVEFAPAIVASILRRHGKMLSLPSGEPYVSLPCSVVDA
jgi:hypothetical protein